jgi:two-component system chemotaxis response regulator CheB
MNWVVVIAASAGSVSAVIEIVAALPASWPSAMFIAFHTGARPSILPELLNDVGKLPSSHPENGELIEPGHVYVAPPDCHMRVGHGHIWLRRDPRVHFTRPAADPLFQSAAEAYGDKVIGIVLSGGSSDGAAGLTSIKAHGGWAIVQDPDEAPVPTMPKAAIAADNPDQLSAHDIAKFLALRTRDGIPGSGSPD